MVLHPKPYMWAHNISVHLQGCNKVNTALSHKKNSTSISKITFIALNLCNADSKVLRTISKTMNQGNSQVCTMENHWDMEIAKEVRCFQKDMP